MAFINPIDSALLTKFSTPVTNVTVEGTSYPVNVVIQTPEEQIKKAVYPIPSIGIQFVGLEEAPEREVDRVWQHSDLTATTLKRREAPIKFNLRYQILTHCYFAEHDRLLCKLILNRLHPKGGLLVVTEEGNTVVPVTNPVTPPRKYNLQCFKEGMQNLDQMGDFREFKKAFTYSILGWLDEATATAYRINNAGVTIETDLTSAEGYHP